MLKYLIYFQRLCQVPRAFVEDLIISKIQVREHLGRKQKLRNLTRSRVANSIVRKIKLTDGFVQSEPLDQYVH